MASEGDLHVSLPAKLQLTDVYEIAEKVGEQFQLLIKQFGTSQLCTVVPTVVGALEHLERYVEENQRLEITSRKLMLQVDSLACEKEQRMKLTNEVDDLLLSLETEKESNKRLGKRIERLMMRNEDLAKQLDRLKGTALKPVARGEDPLHTSSTPTTPVPTDDSQLSFISTTKETSLDFHQNGSVVDANSPDHLQYPRMSKRLSQVELELQKTRRKLVEAHHSLQTTAADNRLLKSQLEEAKAEAALNNFEPYCTEPTDPEASCKTEPPKFYKQDLLAVLRERNELKEELDRMKDELKMAREETRQLHLSTQRRGSTSTLPSFSNIWHSRPRSTSSRVTQILDSITESVRAEPFERTHST